jgi:UDP-3-O-[3-hydroxymyristoyl] glucosamine N-acyltransferase
MKSFSDQYKQYKNVTVYEGASIGENVHIGEGTIIYPNTVIEANTFIGPYCILGEPTAQFYNDPEEHIFKKTVIADNSLIRSNTIIYKDVSIGENFHNGHRVTIREGTRIGTHCRIGTLCDLQGKLTIGNHPLFSFSIFHSREVHSKRTQATKHKVEKPFNKVLKVSYD